VLNPAKERKKLRSLLLVSLLVVGGAAGASVALRPACERTIVTGELPGDFDARVTAVAAYANGMFYGNPVLAHVEGTVPKAGWFTITLPGFRDPDHLRIRSGDAPVTAFFNDGERVTFDIPGDNATFPASVSIDYIAGTAWWSHRYELDLDRSDLALVARVHWQAEALFRGVDLLLVSGEIHTANTVRPPPGPVAADSAGFGGGWFTTTAGSTSGSGGLRAFTVPSSRDAGIYVVHRAEDVDLPGAAGKDARACREAGFSLRVYESPVNASEFVVATFKDGDAPTTAAPDSPGPVGLPAFLELVNAGTIPWVPGLVEVWRDGVLVGSDQLAYTAGGGAALIQTGTSFDIEAERGVESTNSTVFVNYTLRNVDAVPHRVELREMRDFGNETLAPPFAREGGGVVARVALAPQQVVVIGFTAAA